MNTKGLNANQLKIIAMTIDHLVAVIYPKYPLIALIT